MTRAQQQALDAWLNTPSTETPEQYVDRLDAAIEYLKMRMFAVCADLKAQARGLQDDEGPRKMEVPE